MDKKKYVPVLSVNEIISDKYRLLEQIGIGGMTEIWKIEIIDSCQVDIIGSRYAALSVINSKFIEHPQAKLAFEHQYRVACLMKHPNIVKVFQYGEDKKKSLPFVIMELLEGKTLYHAIQEKIIQAYSKKQKFKLIENIANAISFIHGSGFVHSDIKPDNIFIKYDGSVKIFDFSISRKLENITSHDVKLIKYDAKELHALTYSYASLEMIQQTPPHTADDVYSFALVIYYILTGEHAYQGLPANEVEKENVQIKKIKGISNKQNSALKKALSLHREQRFLTIDEFCIDFKPKKFLFF